MTSIVDVVLLLIFAVGPAIVLHECAHGLVAYWMGDSTAKSMGRLTLNPIKHMDPVGSIIVPGAFFLMRALGLTHSLILFGWAKPVPVNFRQLRNPRLGMLLVAAAGPLTNIILAVICVQLLKMPISDDIARIVGWAILFNLTLAVFNMIPIPPLDGSRIVTALLPIQIARYYVQLEPYGFIIVVILVQLGMLKFLYPVISAIAAMIGIQL